MRECDLEVIVEKYESGIFRQKHVADELPGCFVFVDSAGVQIFAIVQYFFGIRRRIQIQRDIKISLASIFDQTMLRAASNNSQIGSVPTIRRRPLLNPNSS